MGNDLTLAHGSKVGTVAKAVFCFYEGNLYADLPGTFASRVYRNCGSLSNLSLVMGLSIGLQYIDITGLAPRRYRLQVTADGNHWFQETNESNSVTWVDIRLKSQKGIGFVIISYGPAL